MSSTLTYWPGTHILKSRHTPYNWRLPGTDPRPLNADIKATAKPKKLGGRMSGISFGHADGTMPHLHKTPGQRAKNILATRPPHVGFVIPKASAASKAARA